MAISVCDLKDKVWVRFQDGYDMIDVDTFLAATHILRKAWERE